eukprot:tig00021246_g19606.t1
MEDERSPLVPQPRHPGVWESLYGSLHTRDEEAAHVKRASAPAPRKPGAEPQLQPARAHRLPLNVFTDKLVGDEDLERIGDDGLRRFYIAQNSLIRSFEEVEERLPEKLRRDLREGLEEGTRTAALGAEALPGQDRGPQASVESRWEGPARIEARQASHSRALIRISFTANIVVVFFKLLAVFETGSLSVLGSTLESALDILSSLILWRPPRTPTAGRPPFEPIGVVIFAAIMGTASFNLVAYSVKELMEGKPEEQLFLGPIAASILGAIIALKLVLWMLCARSDNASVIAFAKSHRNDVAINALGTAFAYVGSNYYWWVDPLGALLFSAAIVADYAHMSHGHARPARPPRPPAPPAPPEAEAGGPRQVKRLAGHSADPALLSALCYIAYAHDERVRYVSSLIAYHVGTFYHVEATPPQ